MCNCSRSPGTQELEVRPPVHALPWRLRKAVRQGRLTMQEALAVRARGLSIAQAIRRRRRAALARGTSRPASSREPWRPNAEVEEMEGETSGARISRRTAPPMRASFAAPTADAPVKPAGQPLSTRYACFPESAAYCIGWTVTEGPFGLALARFTDAACDSTFVSSVLVASPTFVAMVKELDKRYVGLGTRQLCRTNKAGASEPIPWQDEFKPDANGVLTKGPFKGRRVIEFVASKDGSYFAASGSMDSNVEWDTIAIQDHPPGKSAHAAASKAARVHHIAHETAHAFRFVTGANGPRGATRAARIHQFIQDELETRKIEAKVIAEAARAKGGEFLQGDDITGALDIDGVERSFGSGKLMMTYLEKAVLEELMIEAIRALGPTATKQQIEAIDRAVDSVPIFRHGFYDQDHASILLPPKGAAANGPRATAYGRYRLLRRAI
ncbi:MAG TPA: hypothetical protein VFN38_10670, partial [Gemmatimonadaceae bacterium]|nr:hypothetical protein [Gemmatimonadaceae bacterium]